MHSRCIVEQHLFFCVLLDIEKAGCFNIDSTTPNQVNPTHPPIMSCGCNDTCGMPRDAEVVQTMDEEETVTLLCASQAGVLIVVGVQAALHVLWQMAELVPGFTLYDGASGAVSAYTHGAWWQVIDLIVILVGLVSVYFGLNYVRAQNVVERGLARNLVWITMYMVLLGVGIVAHIVHASLSLAELVRCDSTLCTNNDGVLIGLVVILFVDTLLCAWGIFRAWSFQTTLRNAIAHWESILVVKTSDAADAPQASAPTGARIGVSIHGYRPLSARAPANNKLSMPLIHKMK